MLSEVHKHDDGKRNKEILFFSAHPNLKAIWFFCGMCENKKVYNYFKIFKNRFLKIFLKNYFWKIIFEILKYFRWTITTAFQLKNINIQFKFFIFVIFVCKPYTFIGNIIGKIKSKKKMQISEINITEIRNKSNNKVN